MSTGPNAPSPDSFPLPKGIKLRKRIFGKTVGTPPIPVFPDSDANSPTTPRPPFKLQWEDAGLGVTVTVTERDDGHLIAEAFSREAGRAGSAAVSVGLVGTIEGRTVRKTIPLSVIENTGCRGSADFGPLADAARDLGSHLGMVVILLVEPRQEQPPSGPRPLQH